MPLTRLEQRLYAAARRDGCGVADAVKIAKSRAAALDKIGGWKDSSQTWHGENVERLAQWTDGAWEYRAIVLYDADAESPDYLGEWSRSYTRDAVYSFRVPPSELSNNDLDCAYFVPEYSVKDRAETFRGRGYSRHDAYVEARRGVEADRQRFKAWYNNQWHFVGVVVEARLAGDPEGLWGPHNGLWAIDEGENDDRGGYLACVALDMTDEARDEAVKYIEKTDLSHHLRQRLLKKAKEAKMTTEDTKTLRYVPRAHWTDEEKAVFADAVRTCTTGEDLVQTVGKVTGTRRPWRAYITRADQTPGANPELLKDLYRLEIEYANTPLDEDWIGVAEATKVAMTSGATLRAWASKGRISMEQNRAARREPMYRRSELEALVKQEAADRAARATRPRPVAAPERSAESLFLEKLGADVVDLAGSTVGDANLGRVIRDMIKSRQ